MNTENLTMTTINRAAFKNCGELGTTNKRAAKCPCCGEMIAPFEGRQFGISRCMNGVTLHDDCIKAGIASGAPIKGTPSKRCIPHHITATLHCQATDVEAVWVDLVAGYKVACKRQGCLLHIISPLYVSNNTSSNLFELLSDLGVKINIAVDGVEFKDVDAITYKKLTDRKAPRF